MRRYLAAVVLLFSLWTPAFAALSANTVWEVWTTGADTNGGGFVTGSSGTDYTQRTTPQYALTNGVTNTTTTIATVSASADMVGNIAFVTGGTGAVAAAWYQIISVVVGVSITVDRSTGLTAGTGVTINVGGTLATISQMLTNLTVAGMTSWVKATATYSISTGLSDANGAGGIVSRIVGYTTTRGDGLSPTIRGTAAITLVTVTAGNHSWENFILDCNTATATSAFNSSTNSRVFNLAMKNCSGSALLFSVGVLLGQRIEISGSAGSGALNYTGTAPSKLDLEDINIHDNTTVGIFESGSQGGLSVVRGIVSNNTGASSDGNQLASPTLVLSQLSIHGNGRDGIRATNAGVQINTTLTNTIIDANTGVGVNLSGITSTTTQIASFYNNAYFNNMGGARVGFPAEAGAVTLSADPYVNAAGSNFALNTTVGGGAACRAAGIPGAFPGGSTTGFLDIGAAQHGDPAPPAIGFGFVQ